MSLQMDQSSQAQDSFINLSPLTSVNRQSAYISRPPGPVSLVSLFPMDEQPAQVGLLHNMQNIMPYNMGVPQFSRNPSLIQVGALPARPNASAFIFCVPRHSLKVFVTSTDGAIAEGPWLLIRQADAAEAVPIKQAAGTSGFSFKDPELDAHESGNQVNVNV